MTDRQAGNDFPRLSRAGETAVRWAWAKPRTLPIAFVLPGSGARCWRPPAGAFSVVAHLEAIDASGSVAGRAARASGSAPTPALSSARAYVRRRADSDRLLPVRTLHQPDAYATGELSMSRFGTPPIPTSTPSLARCALRVRQHRPSARREPRRADDVSEGARGWFNGSTWIRWRDTSWSGSADVLQVARVDYLRRTTVIASAFGVKPLLARVSWKPTVDPGGRFTDGPRHGTAMPWAPPSDLTRMEGSTTRSWRERPTSPRSRSSTSHAAGHEHDYGIASEAVISRADDRPSLQNHSPDRPFRPLDSSR